MTTQSDFYVERGSTFSSGVYVVLVLDSSQGCDVAKEVTVTVAPALPLDQYASKVLSMLSLFLVPTLAYFVLLGVERCRSRGFSFNEPADFEQSLSVHVNEVDGDDEVRVVLLTSVFKCTHRLIYMSICI